jgi:hypothetical protein
MAWWVWALLAWPLVAVLGSVALGARITQAERQVHSARAIEPQWQISTSPSVVWTFGLPEMSPFRNERVQGPRDDSSDMTNCVAEVPVRDRHSDS